MTKILQIIHGALFHNFCHQNLILILIYLIFCLNQTEKVKIVFLFGLVLKRLNTPKKKPKL